MKIVTAGARYMDVDAYAGCVAYAELLQLQGFNAVAVSTAPVNESVTKTMLSWNAPLLTTYIASPDDSYILVDVSDPDHFSEFVQLDKVEEVIDHHPGFEEYWQEKIAANAHIEFIGAACTQVYELWKAAGKLELMSQLSARLLVSGILDNTLNFGAHVTTARDKVAYEGLLHLSSLPADWPAQYFTDCQAGIFSDIAKAIKNDTKFLDFKSYATTVCVGQLVVWDGQAILDQHRQLVEDILQPLKPDWFMNLVSVSEGKSYFVASNSSVQQWLLQLLNVRFDGDVAIADRLWLRKEIIQQDIVAAQGN